MDKLYKSSDPPENSEELLIQMETKMSAIETRIREWERICDEWVCYMMIP